MTYRIDPEINKWITKEGEYIIGWKLKAGAPESVKQKFERLVATARKNKIVKQNKDGTVSLPPCV